VLKILFLFFTQSAANAVSEATGGRLDYLINNAGIHDQSKTTLDTLCVPLHVEKQDE
jgi:NAD(P)-dependent dehydrogenase (short-subunit alcohol dehydrogenase family)